MFNNITLKGYTIKTRKDNGKEACVPCRIIISRNGDDAIIRYFNKTQKEIPFDSHEIKHIFQIGLVMSSETTVDITRKFLSDVTITKNKFAVTLTANNKNNENCIITFSLKDWKEISNLLDTIYPVF